MNFYLLALNIFLHSIFDFLRIVFNMVHFDKVHTNSNIIFFKWKFSWISRIYFFIIQCECDYYILLYIFVYTIYKDFGERKQIFLIIFLFLDKRSCLSWNYCRRQYSIFCPYFLKDNLNVLTFLYIFYKFSNYFDLFIFFFDFCFCIDAWYLWMFGYRHTCNRLRE